MLSLRKAGAREAVEVSGALYAVHTDFRYWLRFSEVLRSGSPLLSDFDFMYARGIPEDRHAGLFALMDFYADKKELPRARGAGDRRRVIDYDTDADLIYAAFMEVYGIDLTEERLHWHKFRALMDGLHGTKLNEVIGYRLYDGSDAGDWKKRMAELHEMWELPEELTDEEKEAADEFDAKLEQV